MAVNNSVPALIFLGLAVSGWGTVEGAAQETTVEVAPVDVQEVPDDLPANPRENDLADAPAPARVIRATPQALDVAVINPEPVIEERRLFVDTVVSSVQVSDVLTVAEMSPSPRSRCASGEYVFERDRPKWLFQTGRLLQAMKEGATVRVSFSCVGGRQSINAIQFLSPPGAQAVAMPRRGQSVEAVAAAQARSPSVPLPAN